MTESEITEQLAGWQRALTAVQSGASYTIGGVRNGRTLERADLKEIRETIDWLEAKLAQAQSGGKIRVRRVVL